MREYSLRQELAQMPIFRDMTPNQLETIGSRFRPMKFKEGEVIYHEGGEWGFIGLILSGSVRAKMRDMDNRQVVLGETRSRSAIGMFNLRDGARAPATMKTASEVRLAALPIAELRELKQEHPALALVFYEGILLHISQVARRLAAYITDVCPPEAP